FSLSEESRYSSTLISKNGSASLIGLQPVKLEVLRQSATVLPQPGQKLARARDLLDLERPLARSMDLDVIAFLELQRLDYGSREPDGEAIAPFGDLHWPNLKIYVCRKYIHRYSHRQLAADQNGRTRLSWGSLPSGPPVKVYRVDLL